MYYPTPALLWVARADSDKYSSAASAWQEGLSPGPRGSRTGADASESVLHICSFLHRSPIPDFCIIITIYANL